MYPVVALHRATACSCLSMCPAKAFSKHVVIIFVVGFPRTAGIIMTSQGDFLVANACRNRINPILLDLQTQVCLPFAFAGHGKNSFIYSGKVHSSNLEKRVRQPHAATGHMELQSYSGEKRLCKPWRPKVFFIINVLVISSRFI